MSTSHDARDRDAHDRDARRGALWWTATIGALVLAGISAAAFDRAVSPQDPDALPRWVAALAGVACALASFALGRSALRHDLAEGHG